MIKPGFISPRAVVSQMALIAPDVRIYGSAYIGDHVVLGSQVVIGHASPTEQRRLLKVIEARQYAGRDDYDDIVDVAVVAQTIVEAGVIIRSGSVVYSGTIIRRDADIAHNCVIREDCEIGMGTHILTGTQVMASVRIGGGCRIAGTLCNRTKVGHAASMLGHAVHNYKVGVPGYLEKSPRIGNGAIVGREAAIVGDVKIGDFAIVGAGAVVRSSIPGLAIWAGNPATPRGARKLEECEDLALRVKKYAK